jgi:hypothetical protein
MVSTCCVPPSYNMGFDLHMACQSKGFSGDTDMDSRVLALPYPRSSYLPRNPEDAKRIHIPDYFYMAAAVNVGTDLLLVFLP